jgi:starch synthase
MGSYMFGYINALKEANVNTILFFVSARITSTLHFTHAPTGTPVRILPAPKPYRVYRSMRRGALNASGISETQKFGDVYSTNKVKTSLLMPLKNAAKSLGSYLSIPWKQLTAEMQQTGCDLLLCQEYEHARFDTCVLLGKRLGLPVFATFQGGDAPQSFIERSLRPFTLKQSAGVVIATQTEVERVQNQYNISTDKIARIFNPIDLSVWQVGDRAASRQALNLPETAEIVICHGRIEIERKGLDVLLQAWQQLCKQYPDRDLRLFLIGTGSDANKLDQMLSAMQLRGVTWVNQFVRDRAVIQRYLLAADLYVLPSRHEGFPVAPLEAMACRLPVVAADAQGIPDIFEQQETCGGLVVPRGDATELAKAIDRVLNDSDLRCLMSESARQRVEAHFP